VVAIQFTDADAKKHVELTCDFGSAHIFKSSRTIRKPPSTRTT
jgi:hypothetical protein